jgi:hypothetical protein
MAPTLQGTPIGGEERQHPLEFLDGIDLEGPELDRIHPRREGPQRTWLAAGLVVLLVLSMAVWFLLARSSTPEPALEEETVTAHDSGIARIVEERQEALASVHDSGIARILESRADAVTTPQTAHDSGIALIVEERVEALADVHDSGIARVVEERAEALDAVHDSGIELARRSR